MAGEDLLRAVQLFEQHAAHQQVRPGHRSEREHRVGALDDGGPEPVGAADREGDGAGAGVAPGREAVGEFDGCVQAAPRSSSATSRAPGGSAARISSASRVFSSAAGRRRFSSTSMIVGGGRMRPA